MMPKLFFSFCLILCLATPAFAQTKPAPAPTPALAPIVTVTSSAEKVVGDAPPVVVTPPPDITPIVNANPSTFLDSIKTAFSSKTWGILVGYILMLIVYLVVTFAWSDFPADYLPYLSIAFGIIGSVGWELSIGKQSWWQAILSGITTGWTATGAWETPHIGGKALLGSIGDRQDAAKNVAAK